MTEQQQAMTAEQQAVNLMEEGLAAVVEAACHQAGLLCPAIFMASGGDVNEDQERRMRRHWRPSFKQRIGSLTASKMTGRGLPAPSPR